MKYLFTFFALALLCHAPVSAQVGPRRGRTGRVVVPLELPPAPPEVDPADELAAGAVVRCEDAGRAARRAAAGAAGEAAEGETAYRGSEVDTKAVVEETPEPAYTRQARAYGTSGLVALRATLAATGRVSEVKVLRALPDGLTASAADAACGIRFKPALKDGRPVSQYVTVEFSFEADDMHLPPPGSRRPAGLPPPGVRGVRRFPPSAPPVPLTPTLPSPWGRAPFPLPHGCVIQLF